MREDNDPITEALGRLVTTLDVIGLEAFVPEPPRGPGRPPEDRRALARAFVAKAVLGVPITSALIERLDVDKSLRRILGWERRSHKAVLAFPRQLRNRRATAGLLPQPLEHQRRPDAADRNRRRGLIAGRAQDHRLGRKPRARTHQPLQLTARLQFLETPERCDHLLTHFIAVAAALDDLQTGAKSSIPTPSAGRSNPGFATRRTFASAWGWVSCESRTRLVRLAQQQSPRVRRHQTAVKIRHNAPSASPSKLHLCRATLRQHRSPLRISVTR